VFFLRCAGTWQLSSIVWWKALQTIWWESVEALLLGVPSLSSFFSMLVSSIHQYDLYNVPSQVGHTQNFAAPRSKKLLLFSEFLSHWGDDWTLIFKWESCLKLHVTFCFWVLQAHTQKLEDEVAKLKELNEVLQRKQVCSFL